MKKLSVKNLDLSGKRVLMRVDFNVPLKDGRVLDDTRIKAALPTIEFVIQQGASLVLMSHLGRPKGRVAAELSLRPVANRLGEILGRDVGFVPECIGEQAATAAAALARGGILLLENVRFHEEEEGKVKHAEDADADERAAAKATMTAAQEEFARKLAGLGDIYVNDAFGTAHRAHASTAVVARFFEQSAAGLLLEKEITYLDSALAAPQRPFAAVLGGAKVSDKVNVILKLLERVDLLLIGGAMAYTFYRARGLPVGRSLVEEERIGLAQEIIAAAQERGVPLLLPIDHVIAEGLESSTTEIVPEAGIKDDYMALDIGPATRALFAEKLSSAKTIVWNGPMGCFEVPAFAAGTLAVAEAIADTDCLSIIGGGDSVSAINQCGLADKMSHMSTGGGASLELLEGRTLPGVAALTDAEPANLKS